MKYLRSRSFGQWSERSRCRGSRSQHRQGKEKWTKHHPFIEKVLWMQGRFYAMNHMGPNQGRVQDLEDDIRNFSGHIF
jgi:hypothetical protein